MAKVQKAIRWSGRGMQPAQLQLHPEVRPANSQIQSPPLAPSVRARIGRVERQLDLLEELRVAQARILELEAELERSRPPF